MENFQIIQKLFKVFHQNHYINEQKIWMPLIYLLCISFKHQSLGKIFGEKERKNLSRGKFFTYHLIPNIKHRERIFYSLESCHSSLCVWIISQ